MKNRVFVTYIIAALLLPFCLFATGTGAASASNVTSIVAPQLSDSITATTSLQADQWLHTPQQSPNGPIVIVLQNNETQKDVPRLRLNLRSRTLRAGLNRQVFRFGIPRAP